MKNCNKKFHKKIIKNFKNRLFINYQYSFLFLHNSFIKVYLSYTSEMI